MSTKIDSVEDFGFSDAENARNYAEIGPASFVPGFADMHRSTTQLLTETAGMNGSVLVLGAGGGHELKAFSEARPEWSLIAVDPAPAMLAEAKRKLGDVAEQAQWVEGYIHEAPAMQADAATCLLTLHLIPDDETKIETLKHVRNRLKPGGHFALLDNCIDVDNPNAERWFDRYIQYGVESGVPREQAEQFRSKMEAMRTTRSPAQEEQLLREAGFSDLELYYVGLSWRGWISKA